MQSTFSLLWPEESKGVNLSLLSSERLSLVWYECSIPAIHLFTQAVVDFPKSVLLVILVQFNMIYPTLPTPTQTTQPPRPLPQMSLCMYWVRFCLFKSWSKWPITFCFNLFFDSNIGTFNSGKNPEFRQLWMYRMSIWLISIKQPCVIANLKETWSHF